MSILINKDTRIVTQGITGNTGEFHTTQCLDYAFGKECFVAGVTPGKEGQSSKLKLKPITFAANLILVSVVDEGVGGLVLLGRTAGPLRQPPPDRLLDGQNRGLRIGLALL